MRERLFLIIYYKSCFTGSRLQKYWYFRPSKRDMRPDMLQISVSVIKLVTFVIFKFNISIDEEVNNFSNRVWSQRRVHFERRFKLY